MKIKGIYTPVVTPFRENFEIDFESLEKILKFLLKKKIHGIVVGGTTGEYFSLNFQERIQLFEFVKKIVGNKTFKKNYNESALVLNLVHEKKLNNTAYEIFYKTGPLAILPMNSLRGFSQSTIIWSNNDKFLKQLISFEDIFIKSFMEEKIGNIVGTISKINSSQIFPLSAHINDSFINYLWRCNCFVRISPNRKFKRRCLISFIF